MMEKFSNIYKLGCFCVYIVSLFRVISFISPYWVQTSSKTYSEFSNLGLWEICFNDYKNKQIFNKKIYLDGCVMIFSKELSHLRNYFRPEWFIIVQILSILSFLITFLALALVLLSLFTKLREKFIFVLILTFLTTILVSLDAFTIVLFGASIYIHEWTPEQYYENNIYFSFSFWFQFLSICLSFCASIE